MEVCHCRVDTKRKRWCRCSWGLCSLPLSLAPGAFYFLGRKELWRKGKKGREGRKEEKKEKKKEREGGREGARREGRKDCISSGPSKASVCLSGESLPLKELDIIKGKFSLLAKYNLVQKRGSIGGQQEVLWEQTRCIWKHWCVLWLELCPPKRYVEVLTFHIYDYDLIWK